MFKYSTCLHVSLCKHMHGLEEDMKCSPLSLSTFSFRARSLSKSKALAWGIQTQVLMAVQEALRPTEPSLWLPALTF